jgi:hypothetical protein
MSDFVVSYDNLVIKRSFYHKRFGIIIQIDDEKVQERKQFFQEKNELNEI